MCVIDCVCAGITCDEAQRRQFLRLWNLKEAYCKAQGLGIITTMRHSTFSLWNAGHRAGCRHSSPPLADSSADQQGRAWLVAVQPPDERAALSVLDFDEVHTAALCVLTPQGRHEQPQPCAVQHFMLGDLTGQSDVVRLGQAQACC